MTVRRLQKHSVPQFTSRMVLGLLLTLTPALARAQTREVTGRVTIAESRQPLAGASVNLVGRSNVGTVTNDRGQYRLMVPAGDQVLLVRFLGYKRRTVQVAAAQSTADVSLEKDVLELEGVVVTGQATTVERRNAATAVSVVRADELTRVSAVSVESALQGKVVGANIQMNNGAPGGGGQIQIRGTSSILGNAEPLIVVDGVIVSNQTVNVAGINSVTRSSSTAGPSYTTDNEENRLADINQNDIESIELLKGAGASAIYGAKATNGVIVITTKRGRAGDTRVSGTQRIGVYQPERLLGSRHFPSGAALAAARGSGLDSATAAAFCNPTCPYYDYQADFFGQRSPSYETILSANGGNERTKFFVSVSDKLDRGTMINTSARKQSIRANIDETFSTRWTAGVSTSFVRDFGQRGVSNNDNTFTSPFYLFAYSPAVIDLQARDANGNFLVNPFAGGGATSSNPFQTLTYLTANEDVYRSITSARVNYLALSTDRSTLNLSAIAGVDWFNQDDQLYSPNFLQYEPNDGFLGTAVQGNGVSRQVNSSANAVWGFTPLSRLFTATTSAGLQYEARRLNSYNLRARGLIPGVANVNQGTQDASQTKTEVRDQAFYGQEELLAFSERLLLSAGFRAERSSVNGDRDKFYLFPRGGLSYRFVAPVPSVDEVKLRASVGTSGNQPRYGDRDLTFTALGLIGGQNALGATQTLGNTAIKPEKMTEQEYGVDARFLDSRVSFEGTYFDRTITDLLLTAPLAPTSGLTQQIINGGKITSKGWELAATVNPIRTQDLSWVSRNTFYHVAGQVVSLPVPAFVVPSSGFGAGYGRARISPGYSTTAIWGNLTHADGTFADTVIGDATPKFTMQFGNDITWKALSLNLLIDWRKGGDVSNLTQNIFDEGKNSWDYDQPSPDPTVGATLGAYRYNSWRGSHNAVTYVQDGSYVKLREVSVGLDVPDRYYHYIPSAKSLRVSVTARNLHTWTSYWGLDPDAAQFGNQAVRINVDHSPYPPSRSYFFTFDLGY
ncbi:MAG TPA: SusC/RagA family TonB-linked outer membrane protein [Gemmatimonadaceae bacterium]